MSDNSVDGKDSLYVIDGFSIIDYIKKNNPTPELIEIFIRNHMRPGHYDEPKKDFPERDTLYHHDQVLASQIKLCKMKPELPSPANERSETIWKKLMKRFS